jgi:NAD(P)-dependent dehydrogenase (short-subunit alcohol dehydrogenase family)
MSVPLTGRSALVTGAARGLGRAIAERLAAAGADVAVLDLDAAAAADAASAIAAAHGRRAIAVVADVSRSEDADRAVAEAVAALGGLDILVNNAGVSHVGDPTEAVTDEAWFASIGVMQTGTFLMTRAAGRVMLERGRGSVVNIASVRGFAPHPDRLPYAAAKAAVLMMTRCTAAEWAGRGVRVNAIAPGVMRTEMWDRDVAAGVVSEAVTLRSVPAGRLGEPAEIGDVAVFLCSDAAGYITGECLVVDGGLTTIQAVTS